MRHLRRRPRPQALGYRPGTANRVGSWFGALSSGPTKGGMTPWLIVFLIFFGTGILSTLLALFL